MRVRPQRPTDRRGLFTRRPHVIGRPPVQPPAPEQPAPAAQPHPGAEPEAAVPGDHLAERRHRESVAPEDHAHYGCQCGFQFEAAVSTTVTCPHCGASQAW